MVAERVVVRPSEGEPTGEPDGKPEQEKETLGEGVCEIDTLALKLLAALCGRAGGTWIARRRRRRRRCENTPQDRITTLGCC